MAKGTADAASLVLLEHVNLNVIDAAAAEEFFVGLLGCARNPRGGCQSAHFDCGACQFHMPYKATCTGEEPVTVPQVWDGDLTLWVEDIATVRRRLEALGPTGPKWREERNVHGQLQLVLSWHSTPLQLLTAPQACTRFSVPGTHAGVVGSMLHMPRVRHRVAPGTTLGLARWYSSFLRARVQVQEAGAMSGETKARPSCTILFDSCDPRWPQELCYEEDPDVPQPVASDPIPEEHTYHICVYLATPEIFEQCFRAADAAGAIFVNERFASGPPEFGSATTWQEADTYSQYRLRDMYDPDPAAGGRLLLRLEHEVRKPAHRAFPLTLHPGA